MQPHTPDWRRLDRDGLQSLLDALQRTGHTVLGPRHEHEGVRIGRLHRIDDLPAGWRNESVAGGIRWTHDGNRLFAYHALPESWKHLVFPARERIWSIGEDGRPKTELPETPERRALFGMRACDVHALAILDRVFLGTDGRDGDPHYRRWRDGLLIVAVECASATATCFCHGMGAGPAVHDGADIVLFEPPGTSTLIARAASRAGAALLAALKRPPAREDELDARERRLADVGRQTDWRMAERLPRRADPAHYRHDHWADVGRRCLACGNCTAACPSCFCFDLAATGGTLGPAGCDRHWSSCFTSGHSELHGVPVRHSTGDRYRQWLMHKLVTWHEQFDGPGCVGCGRCIQSCPAAIDLRREAEAVLGGTGP